MPAISQPRPALSAMLQLGFEETACYALYRFGLLTGHYRRLTPTPATAQQVDWLVPLNGLDELSAAGWNSSADEGASLLAYAVEICQNKARLFGAAPVPLEMVPSGALAHWTEYEQGKIKPGDQADIKFTWEPARFGWAFILSKAYLNCGNEDYAQSFWHLTDTFLAGSPPYLGPHWISAQEVALRLIALVYSAQSMARSPHSTSERKVQLAEAIASHAKRIPPTLVYARAQNNNHLLSESAGLYTAGLALPNHPDARRWRELGWKWFNRALLKQIAEDGQYSQHSTNYHRLMLQLALWVDAIKDRPFPLASQQRLSAAAGWLANLLDPLTGNVPNLGANDGAYFMPLGMNFSDFRPVVALARQHFRGEGIGQLGNQGISRKSMVEKSGPKVVVQHPDLASWAYLRTAHFNGRPSHADQLHLDLWWQGLNLAMDAGTYQYNAAPPWDNSLACSAVHNTIMIDGQEQMTRAGRFLWLDWAQAEIIGQRSNLSGHMVQVDASHDGYTRLGVRHWRRLAATAHGWMITDDILPIGIAESSSEHTIRLHWLMPDLPWALHDGTLSLNSPRGTVQLVISGASPVLWRAGEVIAGSGQSQPTWGWHSPTYGVKLPALALAAEVTGMLPITLVSEWILPEG